MFGTKPQHEFRVWHVKGRSPVVLYSVAVMYQIAELAVEAYQNSPGGGMDVCGVLYGPVQSGEIRVSASRSLPCEHQAGPEFSLTEADETGWRACLEKYCYEPELRMLRPVGWYVSHSRGGISLNEQEFRAWNRFFPEQEQIVLVLRPHQGRPTRGGFFFRPPDGSPEVGASVLEFEAGPPPQGLHKIRFLNEDVGLHPPVELTEFPVMASRWKRPAAVAAGVLLASAATAYYMAMPKTSQHPDTAVAMHLVEGGGQLRAVWDKSAAPVIHAQSAVLDVQDGASRLEIPVSAALLKNGSWPIIRTSGDVRVRLRMLPQGEASARFIAAGPAPAAQPAEANQREAESQRARIGELQYSLAVLTETNNQLETKAAALQARWNDREAAPARPPAPTPVPVKPPASAPAAVSIAQVAPPPGQGLFPERIASRPPVAALPPAEAPKPSAYAGPMSGKMIWTGLLPAGGTLTIDGRRASAGNVNGPLPGVPVRVSVYPAEFSSGGLVVFSGNPKHSRGNVVEPRSAQNGWLETKYLFDASRAREVAIGEPPASANQFQHLQIRSSGKAVPVLIIEWEVIQ